jgi:hypothetical protein
MLSLETPASLITADSRVLFLSNTSDKNPTISLSNFMFSITMDVNHLLSSKAHNRAFKSAGVNFSVVNVRSVCREWCTLSHAYLKEVKFSDVIHDIEVVDIPRDILAHRDA